MQFLRTFGCMAPWQHLKPVLKHSFLKKLQGMTVHHIDIYITSDLFQRFYINFLLYHFSVSAVPVTSHNWMLYFNFVSRLYNYYISYCIVCFISIWCTSLENIAVRRFINQFIIILLIIILNWCCKGNWNLWGGVTHICIYWLVHHLFR